MVEGADLLTLGRAAHAILEDRAAERILVERAAARRRQLRARSPACARPWKI
jgi:hypothetical protein